MNETIPVTVLTGFLGSGKTTLLNRILSEKHGLRIAVIENEFGEIGIDQALVINADEEVFEMNNGCICCTVRGDLIRILGNLMKRRDKFDHVLVETTGMADPGPVAQTFFVDDEVKRSFRLDGIVTMIDAKHVGLHLDDSVECQQQIAFADVLVLNKTDLVPPAELERLEQRIRRMNAMAKVVRSAHADVPIAQALDVGGFDLKRALETKPNFLEPEYPFEWGAVFALDEGVATLHLDAGPDATGQVALVPAPEDDVVVALRDGAERALRVWKRADAGLKAGATVEPNACVTLALSAHNTSSFALRVPRAGRWLLVTEHGGDEYGVRVAQERQLAVEAKAPLATRVYGGHDHDETVTSVGIHEDGVVDGKRLDAWLGELLREHGADIFRMKGILSLEGQKNRFVFQGVHMLFDGRPERPWKQGEKRFNDLIFIGRNLDRAALVAGFRACLR